jgi:hypothetical protein
VIWQRNCLYADVTAKTAPPPGECVCGGGAGEHSRESSRGNLTPEARGERGRESIIRCREVGFLMEISEARVCRRVKSRISNKLAAKNLSRGSSAWHCLHRSQQQILGGRKQAHFPAVRRAVERACRFSASRSIRATWVCVRHLNISHCEHHCTPPTTRPTIR